MKTKTLLICIWFFALIFWNYSVWPQLLAAQKSPELIVAFLDVGQGDAVFIQAPNGTQMLIDGGKGGEVMEVLKGVMPRGDESIDIVLATHADADHIGGLPAVIDLYDVSMFVDNGDTAKATQIFKKLQDTVSNEKDAIGTEIITARSGMRLELDSEHGVFFDILYPATDSASGDSNELSVVGRLIYGETEFMLTGDASTIIENNLASWCAACLQSDVLKAGHHGSKTSTGELFLKAVQPAYAVISAGEGNSYGHPHAEVMKRLEEKEIKIYATYEQGSIIFVSDGETVKLK